VRVKCVDLTAGVAQTVGCGLRDIPDSAEVLARLRARPWHAWCCSSARRSRDDPL